MTNSSNLLPEVELALLQQQESKFSLSDGIHNALVDSLFLVSTSTFKSPLWLASTALAFASSKKIDGICFTYVTNVTLFITFSEAPMFSTMSGLNLKQPVAFQRRSLSNKLSTLSVLRWKILLEVIFIVDPGRSPIFMDVPVCSMSIPVLFYAWRRQYLRKQPNMSHIMHLTLARARSDLSNGPLLEVPRTADAR